MQVMKTLKNAGIIKYSEKTYSVNEMMKDGSYNNVCDFMVDDDTISINQYIKVNQNITGISYIKINKCDVLFQYNIIIGNVLLLSGK